jgi:hypothetical protein
LALERFAGEAALLCGRELGCDIPLQSVAVRGPGSAFAGDASDTARAQSAADAADTGATGSTGDTAGSRRSAVDYDPAARSSRGACSRYRASTRCGSGAGHARTCPRASGAAFGSASSALGSGAARDSGTTGPGAPLAARRRARAAIRKRVARVSTARSNQKRDSQRAVRAQRHRPPVDV